MAGKGPAPKSGKTPIFAFRLKPQLREALEAAAVENQRPLSEEITARLIRSLREEKEVEAKYGNQANYRMANVLGIAISRANARYPDRDWLKDPVVFDFVKEGIVATLDASRPPEESLDAVGRTTLDNYRAAREIGRSIWREIAEAPQRDPLDPYRNIAEDLSGVVERPNVYRAEFDTRSREKLRSLMFQEGLASNRDHSWSENEGMVWLRRRGELLTQAECETLSEMLAEGKNPRLEEEDTF